MFTTTKYASLYLKSRNQRSILLNEVISDMKENKMNSLNFVIVTIFYCFGEICKGQGIFISQHETKWNQSRCTLAEPNVTCRGDGSCIVENGLEFLTNAEYQDNGFWIGYAKTGISYAYVGCEELNAGVEYSVSTLSECRRTTGCKTFGIQKSTTGLRCTCASNNAALKRTCGEKCEEADQYPCGDTVDTNIFSFYTVENVPPSENSQDIHKNCLLFYPGNYYYWNSCILITFPAVLCSNKYFSEQDPMAESQNQNYGNWSQAVDNCVVRYKFPASIQSINNGKFKNKDKQDHWTGIIKTKSIVSLSEILDNRTNPSLTYAYVEKMNQTFFVRFAHLGESRKSLCARDTPPTQAPALSSSTMSTSHPVPERTTVSLDKDEGGSTAGLAVGLSVSLVVLIIVTVIVLVFLKRRGLLTKCYTQKDEKGNQNEDTRTEISFVSTPIFESTTNTMNDLTASNQSYFVLEKTFNEETKEKTEHYEEPNTTDFDHYDSTAMSQKDTCNEYDTTDGKKGPAKPGLAEPYNKYNKVTLHQTKEYDQIHQTGRPPKSDRQTENEYDISNNLIAGKGHTNFDDDSDTYNHLNIHGSVKAGTDNVYGKSEIDSGYDTSSALKPRRNIDAKVQQADYAVIKKKW